ncbi:POK9 protein, partial [Cardinalis cardinalis]|nr:POK9 protein [Cardinalis cardinalis]
SGSLGLDLATSIDCTLIDCKPQRIQTGVKGPVTEGGQPVGALLIGCSSASMLGLTIVVGLIDADYTGEIQIMVQMLFPPLFIPAGSRIAQLIPLPQLTGETLPLGEQRRGEGSFGSTGTMALLTVDLKHRPKKHIDVQYQGQTITLVALLDTGADVSII